MKRLIPVIISFFALTLSFSVKAQSFEEQIKKAESIKAEYGNTDDRYLDALSQAIQAAFLEEKDEEANKYRLEHAEIVKNKYGINSLEYAEDLWRLGNVSSYKGEAYTFDCYKKAEQIYIANNAKNEFPYCDIMWKFYWHYFDTHDYPLALSYLKQYISLYEPWTQKEWKGNILDMMGYAHAYVVLGDLYRLQLNDQGSSKEAYEKGVEIIEKNNLITDYKYSSLPYAMLADFCSYEKNYDEAVKWQKGYLNSLEQKGMALSEEYISAFLLENQFLMELGDFETIDSDIKHLISLVENRDKEQGIPIQSDSLYIGAKQDLINNCLSFNHLDKSIPYSIDLMQIYESTGKKETADYWRVLGTLIYAYHGTGKVNDAYSLFGQYEDLSKLLGLKDSKEYISYLSLKAEALSLLNKYDDYEQTIAELSSLTKNRNGSHSIEELNQEYLNAANQEGRGNHKEAIKGVERCYSIINSPDFRFNSQKDSLTTMFNLHHLEGYAYISIDPLQAERIIKQAIEDGERISINLSATYLNLGLLYHNWKRDIKLALSTYDKARLISEEAGDNYSINYISIINNIGLCYLELGQSGLAIAFFDIAGNVVEKEYGKQHHLYGVTAQNKSLFYHDISDYPNALIWGEEALKCIEYNYGHDSAEYASALQNQGAIYQQVEDYEKAKEYILESIKINEKANNPNSVYGYTTLLYIYYQENNDEKVLDCAKKALDIINGNDWQETDVAAAFFGAWGIILRLRMNPNSKAYSWKAMDIYNKTGGYDTPRFYAAVLNYAAASFIDDSQADSIIPLMVDSYRNIYLNNTAFYNSKERETFISGSTFAETKNILFSSRMDGSEDTKLFDFLLFNKGLLLGTAISYSKAVYNSGNDEAISHYERLKKLNRFLNGEKTAENLGLSMDEARAQASALERELTLYLRQNGGYTEPLDYSFSDVRDALKTGEIAIEFVTFQQFTSDSTYYAAMLVTPECDVPKYVRLCNKEELDRIVSLSPDRLYGESVASENAYNLIWAPLESYLTGIKTIYFSPAGYLNKMAIEHLYNGKNRVDAIYDVIRLTSTREICDNKPQYKYSSAVLYGGLKYDEDDATMIAESRNIRGESASATDIFRGFDSSVTRKGWEYLPGTLEEVNQISSIISKTKIDCDVYTSVKGNEESFKALSGNNFGILHVATHGFYMTESQAARNDFFASNPFVSQNTDSGVPPLQRSGLLLAGGNKAWKGEDVPEGVEDGILTAAEIASLDLNSCDVVVLSACETGLGEITDEGVLGLQRAFKNAGVNTIIMSLWEVDDQATSLMMQTFYRNLVRGKSKRESFATAQNEVRKKFSDPRYWAAFVILD